MGRSHPLSGTQGTTAPSRPPATPDLDALRAVERRVLWLSAAIVHHANRVRENRSGVKVGGHQASSASMVSLMTALWFAELRAEDRVSVKPHASPVLHAINYLLGRLPPGLGGQGTPRADWGCDRWALPRPPPPRGPAAGATDRAAR